MKNFYYMIDGEEIAVLSSANHHSLPTQGDLSPDLVMQIESVALYFEVFDDTYQDSIYQQNTQQKCLQQNNTHQEINAKHAVLNAKNLSFDMPSNGLSMVPIRSMLTNWSRAEVYKMFKAMQILRWQEDHTFCSRCGSRTSAHRHELAMVCNVCDYRQYPRLQPCVIVVITREIIVNDVVKTQILLAKDRRFKQDMHSVIAGFVEVGETLESAVKREVLEETALQVKNIRYLGSQPWPFPSNIMIAYQAEYAGGELSLDDDELLHADFYDLDNLPNIPPQGTISYEMIKHVCEGKAIEL